MITRNHVLRVVLVGMALFGWNAYTATNPLLVLVQQQHGGKTTLRVNPTAATMDNNDNNTRNSKSVNTSKAEPHKTTSIRKPSLKDTLSSVPLLYPNLALAEYQYYHSTQALQESPDHRKYAIVYWWCPDRAGNILHNFFNSLLWAMITNRTVLWVYEDYWDGTNTFEACSSHMQIADWIPRYDNFQRKLLNLSDAVPIPIDAERWSYDTLHEVVIFPQIPDIQSQDTRIVRNEWRNHPLDQAEYRNYIRYLPESQKQVTAMLYYLKIDYLLGMLFRACFTILVPNSSSSSRLPRTGGDSNRNTTTAFSIALHSRHPVVGDDGSFVLEEQECLRQTISEKIKQNPQSSCVVYLLSDRPKTIELLSDYVTTLGCQPVVASHESSKGGKTEHGPWAGAGFLEDLKLASLARDAVIGDVCRSSFMLLVELITYDRYIEAWQLGGGEIEDPAQCKLKNKNTLAGYNYGPGTPTFRHHSRLAPLEPVAVMQRYQQQHVITSLKGAPAQNRRFIVVQFSCEEQEHSIQQSLNGFLFAILVNRTLLWDTDGTCDGILDPAEWLPSNVEWSTKLNLSLAAPMLTESENDSNRFDNTSVLMFPKTVMSTEALSRFFAHYPEQLKLLEQLLEQGNDFLYGMLFSSAFSFSKATRNVVPSHVLPLYDSSVTTQTIAVDARRWSTEATANTKFTGCLASMVNDSSPTSCHAYIMFNHSLDSSPPTLLSTWLESQNCTVWTTTATEHNEMEDRTTSFFYFSDLALASKARSGFVVPSLSSSESLLLQTIQYNRRMEIWKLGVDPPLVSMNLTKCICLL